MTQHSAGEWISRLGLSAHPEGGFYREEFRSAIPVRRLGELPERTAITSIYYLLEGEDFSGFHRLSSEEIWYFHAGEALHLYVIGNDGKARLHELSFQPSGSLSLAIPANTWFAAEIPGKKGFALCSCAVAPGFEFTEFEMGKKESLRTAFPEAAPVIDRLCRP